MSNLLPTGEIPVIAPSPEVRRSAETATPRDRAIGIGFMTGGAIASQVGAALGAMAFPMIGVVGVVAVRQLTAATILLSTVRPKLRSVTRGQLLRAAALGATLSIMNLTLYASQARIGLGMAVTLEFLGPLAVAIFSSRRRLDIACAILASIGVVVLTNPGPTTDILGIAFALIAAAAWAAYILLNRSLGQRFSGNEGPALAFGISSLVWLPIAIVWFVNHPPTLWALTLAVACGVLASILPNIFDLAALRRVPASMFGTFMSIHPVFAALAGWVILNQRLTLNEWLGIALIVAANLIVSMRGLRSARVSQ